MNKQIKKILQDVEKLAKRKLTSDQLVKCVLGKLSGYLPKEHYDLIISLGGKASKEEKISSLLRKSEKLLLEELKVKCISGEYSILKDSPLKNLSINDEENKMSKFAKDKTGPKKKVVTKKKVATEKKERNYFLKYRRKNIAKNLKKVLSPQAIGILEALQALGGKATKPTLLAEMENHVKSTREMKMVLGFYNKKLIDSNYISFR